MNRRLLLVSGLVLLAGCAPPPRLLTSTSTIFEELEPIGAPRPLREGLSLQVLSTGCTAKDDFAVHLDRLGPVVRLAIARRRLDVCRAAPQPVELTFSWRELGLSPGASVLLLNPVWRAP